MPKRLRDAVVLACLAAISGAIALVGEGRGERLARAGFVIFTIGAAIAVITWAFASD